MIELCLLLNDENTILYIFQPSTVSQIVEARLLLIFIEYNFDASLLSACTLVACLKANLFNYAIQNTGVSVHSKSQELWSLHDQLLRVGD